MPTHQESHIHACGASVQAWQRLIDELANRGLLMAVAHTGALWTSPGPEPRPKDQLRP